MKYLHRLIKWVLYFLLIPATYLLISLILSAVPIERKVEDQVLDNTVYLTTNGVHLDIVIPINNVDSMLLFGIERESKDAYLSFGWGDENFYLNTPTWSDLTISTAFEALFLKSSTLMHVTRYKIERSNWVEIKISDAELRKLNAYILSSFSKNSSGKKMILQNQGYTSMDDFYKAEGFFSCFKTCNTWLNTGFKKSGLRSCLWTPFDFGLLNKYKSK